MQRERNDKIQVKQYIQTGSPNPFYEDNGKPKKPKQLPPKSIGYKTEINQNLYWCYFMRHCLDWIKINTEFKTVTKMIEHLTGLDYYKPPTVQSVYAIANYNYNSPISEMNMLYFAAKFDVDMVGVSRLAMADYIEHQMIEYGIVPDGYTPISNNVHQIYIDIENRVVMNGATPYTNKFGTYYKNVGQTAYVVSQKKF